MYKSFECYYLLVVEPELIKSLPNKRLPQREAFFFVAKLGFEPRQTEPESVVLPLHHLAKPKGN